MTGASEKILTQKKIPYRKIYIHPAHHAGYYPGAEPMTLKLLFMPQTGLIVGAQAVGGAGVDKRIDVIAVAIQAKLTVCDLDDCGRHRMIVKDRSMAGFVAAGSATGAITPQMDVATLVDNFEVERPFLWMSGHRLEFAQGTIPGLPSQRPRRRFTDGFPELPSIVKSPRSARSASRLSRHAHSAPIQVRRGEPWRRISRPTSIAGAEHRPRGHRQRLVSKSATIDAKF
ncbi:MAG: hypothetical protein U0872_07485 [Planctomycetaceae bacterium]